MRKNTVTPTFMRAVTAPRTFCELNRLIPEACVATTKIAAIARIESISGKRGLPGGGVRASGTAAIGVGQHTYAPARAENVHRPHRAARARRAGHPRGLRDPRRRLAAAAGRRARLLQDGAAPR